MTQVKPEDILPASPLIEVSAANHRRLVKKAMELKWSVKRVVRECIKVGLKQLPLSRRKRG